MFSKTTSSKFKLGFNENPNGSRGWPLKSLENSPFPSISWKANKRTKYKNEIKANAGPA